MRAFGWINLLFVSQVGLSQQFSSQNIFAHNDYEKQEPFYNAYAYRVGYIEADVFLENNQLLVAHHRNEIKPERTIESLYLIPLNKEIEKNNGLAYPDQNLQLRLMIDLKTEGIPTLNKLVAILENYPLIAKCRTLKVVISGDVPAPDTWGSFPAYIYFDGRPKVQYTEDQWKRVELISSSFGQYSKWDGKSAMTKKGKSTIRKLLAEVHARNKKFRFWAIPDFDNGWSTLMKLGVDVINTDRVADLAQYIK